MMSRRSGKCARHAGRNEQEGPRTTAVARYRSSNRVQLYHFNFQSTEHNTIFLPSKLKLYNHFKVS